MSFEALAAVQHVEPPSSSALLLLYLLAEYAGPDGVCFPSQETLARRARLSERAVRDNLALLVRDGLIETFRRSRKDGTRTSNRVRLLFYTPLQAADPAESLPAKSAAGGKRAKPDPARAGDAYHHRRNLPVDNRQPTPGLPAITAGLTTFEPAREPITLGSRDREDAAWDELLAAWPHLLDTDVNRARTAFGEASAQAGDPETVVAAAKAYVAELAKPGRRNGPAALQNWLTRGSWRKAPPLPVAAAAPAVATRLPGWAAELRADVACAKGEGFAVSYVDPCSGGEGRALIPATSLAREKLLTRDVGEVLRRHGVTLGEPVRRVG